MQIRFQGQYDKELFFKAVALANQPPKGRQRLLSVLLVIAVGAIGVISYRIISSGNWVDNFVYLAAAIFMGGYVAFIYLRPYLAARKLWENSGTRRPLKGKITEREIKYIFPEGETSIEWGKFNRLRKIDDLITLVRQDGLLVIFPRQFLKNEGDWQKLNKLVDRKVIRIDEKGIQHPGRLK